MSDEEVQQSPPVPSIGDQLTPTDWPEEEDEEIDLPSITEVEGQDENGDWMVSANDDCDYTIKWDATDGWVEVP